ncbi:MAG: hypothetical protein ACE5JU_10350 [Candidatus Binatia bacterium]
MPYIVEVDQSNKVEDSGDTFLAFSDGILQVIKVPSRVKQVGLQALKERGKPDKRAKLLLFAACVFLLLEDHLERLEQVTVDNEYDGRESDVRSFLFEYIRKKHPHFRIEDIVIRSIGKGSPAHILAWEAYSGKRTVDKTIAQKEILAVVA